MGSCEYSEYSTDSLEGWQNPDDRQEVREHEGKTSRPMHSFGAVSKTPY